MSGSLTRRAAIRSGAALAAATFAAGCGDDEETAATSGATSTPAETDGESSVEGGREPGAEGDDVPGVENGIVADARELAIAHDETLRRRSGRIVASVTETNRESGDSARSGIRRVEVDGDRALAVDVGEHLHLSDAAARLEVYTEGNDVYQRRLVDDEWDARRVEPGTGGVRAADLTGRTRLESTLREAAVVGPDPEIAGQYLLRRGGRGGELDGDDENETGAEWFRVHATVDEHGLCHEWGQAIDEDRRDAPYRYSHEARVDGLLETTVGRPDWVDDIEG